MDRYEFVKKIEDMGFHIEYDKYFLYILDSANFQLASISTVYKYQFQFFHSGLLGHCDSDCADFINLVVEYVCSPEEEKKKKKYCLKHKYMIDSSGTGFNHLGTDRETHSKCFITSKHDSVNVQTAFTADEIEELKEKFDTDFSDFEREEYGIYAYEN